MTKGNSLTHGVIHRDINAVSKVFMAYLISFSFKTFMCGLSITSILLWLFAHALNKLYLSLLIIVILISIFWMISQALTACVHLVALFYGTRCYRSNIAHIDFAYSAASWFIGDDDKMSKQIQYQKLVAFNYYVACSFHNDFENKHRPKNIIFLEHTKIKKLKIIPKNTWKK